ncbi:uncharacterized protein LOC110021939 [Phalaenopsis equestris]|uniref:uncharacterized protein LOC110021939 n=1 Tax=Phalaenopsis equestris TaxID=78828 RepID=UPI0009E28A0F|nr:uncharacterized protein LOC110021939 [Phalaenopsis equestris]
MGVHLSSLGKHDLIGTLSSSADEIFDQYFNEKISTFEEFHLSFLEYSIKLNNFFPGKHYDAPPRLLIKKCYEEWSDPIKDAAEKKRLLIELLETHVSISRRKDEAILTTAVVAPGAAIIFKRIVPDVIFVPSVTLMAIAVLKAVQIQKIRKIV